MTVPFHVDVLQYCFPRLEEKSKHFVCEEPTITSVLLSSFLQSSCDGKEIISGYGTRFGDLEHPPLLPASSQLKPVHPFTLAFSFTERLIPSLRTEFILKQRNPQKYDRRESTHGHTPKQDNTAQKEKLISVYLHNEI